MTCCRRVTYLRVAQGGLSESLIVDRGPREGRQGMTTTVGTVFHVTYQETVYLVGKQR